MWSDPMCALESVSLIRPYMCHKICQYDQTQYLHPDKYKYDQTL